MGSPATRAASSTDATLLERTIKLLERGGSPYLITRDALCALIDEVENEAIRGINSAAGFRSRLTPSKGPRERSRLHAVRAFLADFAPERLRRINSERGAALWFALWLLNMVRESAAGDRPVNFLSDTDLRAVLGLADGGAAFFDRVTAKAPPSKRFTIDAVDLSGSCLRAALRRRCPHLLSEYEWATELLDRSLGHPAIVDIVGGRVAEETVKRCQTLLIDMPSSAPQELNLALFAQLGPRERHAVQSAFADSPHPATALWWPKTIAEVHTAAAAWLEANPPQPALFDTAEPHDAMRAWFTALAELTANDRSGPYGDGYYGQRNRINPAEGHLALNADLLCALFAELATRCALVSPHQGEFTGRAERGSVPLFTQPASEVVSLLNQRLGRELRREDLAGMPKWVSDAANDALPESSAEGTVRVDLARLSTRAELKRFAITYAASHGLRLPSKSQIRNLAEVEEMLGCTWWDLCEELISSYPGLRRTLSSYARDGIALTSECFGTQVSVETPVAEFAPNAEDAARCKVDATLWLDDNTVLWFEFDGEGHFVHVRQWDLKRARAGDRRRHRQLRAVRTAGVDATLVAFHHSVLPISGGPLTADALSEIVKWAELEGFKWLFLRPVGCKELRDSEADPGDLIVTRFGDVEVVASELVRPVRD